MIVAFLLLINPSMNQLLLSFPWCLLPMGYMCQMSLPAVAPQL